MAKIQSKIIHGHFLSKLRTLKNTFWFQILTESHRITLIASVRVVGNHEKRSYDDWQNLQKKTIFCPKKICRKGVVALISALAIFGLRVYCAHDKRNLRFTRTTIVFLSSTVRKAWNVVSQKFLINLNHFQTFFYPKSYAQMSPIWSFWQEKWKKKTFWETKNSCDGLCFYVTEIKFDPFYFVWTALVLQMIKENQSKIEKFGIAKLRPTSIFFSQPLWTKTKFAHEFYVEMHDWNIVQFRVGGKTCFVGTFPRVCWTQKIVWMNFVTFAILQNTVRAWITWSSWLTILPKLIPS